MPSATLIIPMYIEKGYECPMLSFIASQLCFHNAGLNEICHAQQHVSIERRNLLSNLTVANTMSLPYMEQHAFSNSSEHWQQ
uniref:Uncharacterized protein n=1 Tax=Arundo donax TaxID=35708 RepID=A0A0A8ZB21_ARUDO